MKKKSFKPSLLIMVPLKIIAIIIGGLILVGVWLLFQPIVPFLSDKRKAEKSDQEPVTIDQPHQ